MSRSPSSGSLSLAPCLDHRPEGRGGERTRGRERREEGRREGGKEGGEEKGRGERGGREERGRGGGVCMFVCVRERERDTTRQVMIYIPATA